MALEIFRLMGSIFIDNKAADASLAKTDQKAEGVGKTLADGMQTAGKWAGAIAQASAIVGGAMIAAGTAAVNQYADYEQAMGGIVTLFDTSADKVIANAEQAYKTAGITATEYMEQVTSFSASLLQSLGGDTSAAAELADMAIRDMADNANKMGTSVSSIQSAYQGFAKQNYTMLDNLKLGYGGTKAEMERLLADAEKISGIKYDISNLDDVYSAIHVIQDELGITGTTALEAGTTISGTMGTIKARFSDFVTQIGSALAPVVQKVLNMVVDNFPKIEKMVNAFIPVIADLFTTLMPPFMDLINAVLPILMELVEALMPLFSAIMESILPIIIDLMHNLMPPIMELVNAILPVLVELLPIITTLLEPVLNLIKPITDIVVDIIGVMTNLIDFVKNIFTGHWAEAWEGVKNIVSNILDAIGKSFKAPINYIIDGINLFIKGLNKIKIPDWVPGVGGKSLSISTIPRLERGGVLERGQVGYLEGNGAEAVVPLENNKKWIHSLAEDMAESGIVGNDNGILEDILDTLQSIAEMGITLDGEKLVGALARPMDKALGRLSLQKARA